MLLPLLLSLLLPLLLLVVVTVWTVAVGGWRIALSRRARAGPTCSACNITDCDNCVPGHSPPSRTDLSRDCLCYRLSFMHVHGCVIFFVKLKGHVHVLVQVPKGFTLIVLQPQANRPVLLSLQKKKNALFKLMASQQITMSPL